MKPEPQTMWLTRKTLTCLLFLLLVLLWGFSLWPQGVEAGYSRRIYPVLFSTLASLTGRLPASLAEVSLATSLLGFISYAGWRGRQLWTKRGERLRVLGRSLQDSLLVLFLVAGLFYVLWGLNYGRPPLAERAGWEDPSMNAEQLRKILSPLAAQAVELTNQAFRECCLTARRVPSQPEISLENGNLFLNQGMKAALHRLDFEAPELGSNQAKPLLVSELMSYLGLAGFYFPWTGEANFNGDMLPLESVHSMAHEKAHQVGFAQEDEANFLGFLACILSEEPYSRYSGYYFASRQLLSLLRRVDREAWKEISIRLDAGILEDQEQIREFWGSYEGQSQRVAQAVNNAHLRLNRVPGGILSYGRSVRLILQWAAANDNHLEPR